jgi:hypothetical protein
MRQTNLLRIVPSERIQHFTFRFYTIVMRG